MSSKRGKPVVHRVWDSPATKEFDHMVQRRTQQLLYFECDIYTISRTLLKAYEEFSEERANILFEKYARKKVTRSVAHFLIDRISFQRKGAFGSKPFRRELTYREIKYFFAWSARPENFMFCVNDEKLQRKSYEIYRCDNIQDVHSVCAFVYKATNDTQFILRNELPVDVISQSMNEMDESLVSLHEEVIETISPQNDTLERANWINRSANAIERADENGRNGYSRTEPVNPESRYSKLNNEPISITRDRPSSGPPLNIVRNSEASSNRYHSTSPPRAVDVYSYYDSSPGPKPRRFPSWGSMSNESSNRTITIARRNESPVRRDFGTQSGVCLVTEATSPFLSTPNSLRRVPKQKKDMLTSPFETTRHLFTHVNTSSSLGSRGQSSVTLKELDVRGKQYVHKDSSGTKLRKNNDPTILYASSESFFDQPLSSDGPLYMYVTYVDSDSQFGGSSTLSRASTRTGTSRTMLDDDSTDGR